MRKQMGAFLLALSLCLSLLPGAALAAEPEALLDWYFLFAAFRNIDADGKDKDGQTRHASYSMPKEEVDPIRDLAVEFEEYMNSVGVMRAHVEVVEIDETVTKLADNNGGSWLNTKLAAPLLEGKVALDRYDHVTCFAALDDLAVGWAGLTGAHFRTAPAAPR